ncbi:hypothetical protein Tco_1173848 [Tanacetum coccineum]
MWFWTGSRVYRVRHGVCLRAVDLVSQTPYVIVLSRKRLLLFADELSSSTPQGNLFLEGNCPTVLGGYIASAPLTPLVKPGGGIRPIAVGTIWRRLVSKFLVPTIDWSFIDGYLSFIALVTFKMPQSDCTTEALHVVMPRVQQGDIYASFVFLSATSPDFKIRYSFNLCLQCLVILTECTIVWELGCRRPHAIADWKCGCDFVSALVIKRGSSFCLERIVKASGSGLGTGETRYYPFAFGGLGIYSAGDVLNYAFIASRLQSATLQTKLLRDVGIVAPGSTFDDALCVFNNAMEIDFLSNPSEVAAPKLMKKMADIYFTRVTKDAESSYSLSPRQMALWQSQKEDHTSDWLRVVPISGLGQTMNGKTYRSVLCYRLGVPLFSVSKPCSACSRVFIEDIYGDHAISCAGIIGIKHRHNMVRDTLVDICFRSGISAGKEVDIGLDGGHDKKLRPADMLLYSWDGGLDVLQTGKMQVYFTEAGRNFSMAQDIGARAASHIFNRIGFSIAKGVGAQIVSRLPSNVL